MISFAPKVDETEGFAVVINLRDHLPPHVHVFRGNAELKVSLTEDAVARRGRGRMARADERRAIALVRRKREFYLAKWKELESRP